MRTIVALLLLLSFSPFCYADDIEKGDNESRWLGRMSYYLRDIAISLRNLLIIEEKRTRYEDALGCPPLSIQKRVFEDKRYKNRGGIK